MSLYLLILIPCITFVSCTVYINAPCPDVKPVANFDWNAYKGMWYEVARYPDDWEQKGDCGSIEYTQDGDNVIFNVSNVVNKQRSSVMGTVKFEDGLLYHISHAFDKSEGSSVIPVNVIAVDYNKYSIVYECIYDEKKKIRHDFSWLMTRNKVPNDEDMKIINDYIKSSKVIMADKLEWRHHSDDKCLIN